MPKNTYTYIPSDVHDAVKAFAALSRMRVPEAYEKIVAEGLSALGFDFEALAFKK